MPWASSDCVCHWWMPLNRIIKDRWRHWLAQVHAEVTTRGSHSLAHLLRWLLRRNVPSSLFDFDAVDPALRLGSLCYRRQSDSLIRLFVVSWAQGCWLWLIRCWCSADPEVQSHVTWLWTVVACFLLLKHRWSTVVIYGRSATPWKVLRGLVWSCVVYKVINDPVLEVMVVFCRDDNLFRADKVPLRRAQTASIPKDERTIA